MHIDKNLESRVFFIHFFWNNKKQTEHKKSHKGSSDHAETAQQQHEKKN